jgi:hypothetical protein
MPGFQTALMLTTSSSVRAPLSPNGYVIACVTAVITAALVTFVVGQNREIKSPMLPSVRPATQVRDSGAATAQNQAAEALVASTGTCTYQGNSIPCYDPAYGYWDSDNNCYWAPVTPVPPRSDPVWLGITDPGSLYNETCETPDGLGLGVLGTAIGFSSDPPPGSPNPNLVDAANQLLALQAVVSLGILGPTVKTAPPSGGEDLIGLPVWMWSTGTSLLGIPLGLLSFNSLTVNIGLPSLGLGLPAVGVGLTVLGKKIDWYMGDGHKVTCPTLGTAYSATAGPVTSPNCGYRYTKANQPGKHYTITAVSTWYVSWAIGVAKGSLTIIRSTTTTLAIDELQVVNQ